MSFLFNYLSLIWWCNRNSILLFFYTISKEPHRGKISLFICSFGLFCQRVSHMDLPLVGLTCFLFEIVVTLQQQSTVCVCVCAWRWWVSFFYRLKKESLFSSVNCHLAHFRLLYISCLHLCEVLSCFKEWVYLLFSVSVLFFCFAFTSHSLVLTALNWGDNFAHCAVAITT